MKVLLLLGAAFAPGPAVVAPLAALAAATAGGGGVVGGCRGRVCGLLLVADVLLIVGVGE